jgi:hypothetical protein
MLQAQKGKVVRGVVGVVVVKVGDLTRRDLHLSVKTEADTASSTGCDKRIGFDAPRWFLPGQ